MHTLQEVALFTERGYLYSPVQLRLKCDGIKLARDREQCRTAESCHSSLLRRAGRLVLVRLQVSQPAVSSRLVSSHKSRDPRGPAAGTPSPRCVLREHHCAWPISEIFTKTIT